MTHPSMRERMASDGMTDTEIKQAEKLCDLIAIGHDGGREAERAAIVAWLRDLRTPSGFTYTNAKWFADAIERGDHHNGRKG